MRPPSRDSAPVLQYPRHSKLTERLGMTNSVTAPDFTDLQPDQADQVSAPKPATQCVRPGPSMVRRAYAVEVNADKCGTYMPAGWANSLVTECGLVVLRDSNLGTNMEVEPPHCCKTWSPTRPCHPRIHGTSSRDPVHPAQRLMDR